MREFLIQLRGDKSQGEIAQLAGISQQMYSRIEIGNCSPSVKVAKRLGDALGFDWTRFFTDTTDTTS